MKHSCWQELMGSKSTLSLLLSNCEMPRKLETQHKIDSSICRPASMTDRLKRSAFIMPRSALLSRADPDAGVFQMLRMQKPFQGRPSACLGTMADSFQVFALPFCKTPATQFKHSTDPLINALLCKQRQSLLNDLHFLGSSPWTGVKTGSSMP